jgi:hypothetical protein
MGRLSAVLSARQYSACPSGTAHARYRPKRGGLWQRGLHTAAPLSACTCPAMLAQRLRRASTWWEGAWRARTAWRGYAAGGRWVVSVRCSVLGSARSARAGRHTCAAGQSGRSVAAWLGHGCAVVHMRLPINAGLDAAQGIHAMERRIACAHSMAWLCGGRGRARRLPRQGMHAGASGNRCMACCQAPQPRALRWCSG